MLVITIAPDISKAANRLDAAAKQVRFAASQTVNRLARTGVDAAKAEMQRAFDRPTPFTMRAFYAHGGTKENLQAQILAREFAGKGTPGWKYLTPEAFGGDRRVKRFERAFQAKFGTTFSVPGSGATLNQYGNMSPGQIEKVLSALGVAEATAGYIANRSRRSAARHGRRQETYFLARSRFDGRPLGIYRVVSSGRVQPVIVFTGPPRYNARFHYRQAVMTSISMHAAEYFRDALQRALATAR